MDYLVKIRSVQTPLNGQFSIGANTVNSKRTSDTSPQTVKAFVETASQKKYQAKISITETVSDSNDLGIFNMNFKQVTSNVVPNPTIKGMITGNKSNGLVYLKHAEKGTSHDTDGQLNEHDCKVVIQKNGASGSGSISDWSPNDYENMPRDYIMKANFSYDPSHYYMVDTQAQASNNAKCFDRSKTENSAWRYGLYSPVDGSRTPAKSGFPINTKADGTGINGDIGYWGLWMSHEMTLNDGDQVYK